jgi:hypothetical protein
LASQHDLDASSSKTLFAEVKDDIAPIRDVLTPRIMSLDEDPHLSLLLVELEEVTRRWNLVLSAIEASETRKAGTKRPGYCGAPEPSMR